MKCLKGLRGLVTLNNGYMVSVVNYTQSFSGVIVTCYYPDGKELEVVKTEDSKIGDYVDCWEKLPVSNA